MDGISLPFRSHLRNMVLDQGGLLKRSNGLKAVII
jgi:hypothetical protein